MDNVLAGLWLVMVWRGGGALGSWCAPYIAQGAKLGRWPWEMEREQKGWQWPWGPCLGRAPWSWGWGSLPLVKGCAGHTWLWSEMGREQVRCGVWARSRSCLPHVLPCGPHTWSKLMWVHTDQKLVIQKCVGTNSFSCNLFIYPTLATHDAYSFFFLI